MLRLLILSTLLLVLASAETEKAATPDQASVENETVDELTNDPDYESQMDAMMTEHAHADMEDHDMEDIDYSALSKEELAELGLKEVTGESGIDSDSERGPGSDSEKGPGAEAGPPPT